MRLCTALLQISCSVVGRNCTIGKEVVLRGCYIHDNVTIWDQAQLTSSIVFEGAVIMSGAVVNSGCTLSFRVSSSHLSVQTASLQLQQSVLTCHCMGTDVQYDVQTFLFPPCGVWELGTL